MIGYDMSDGMHNAKQITFTERADKIQEAEVLEWCLPSEDSPLGPHIGKDGKNLPLPAPPPKKSQSEPRSEAAFSPENEICNSMPEQRGILAQWINPASRGLTSTQLPPDGHLLKPDLSIGRQTLALQPPEAESGSRQASAAAMQGSHSSSLEDQDTAFNLQQDIVRSVPDKVSRTCWAISQRLITAPTDVLT